MNPCIELASKKMYELGKGASQKSVCDKPSLGRVVNSKHTSSAHCCCCWSVSFLFPICTSEYTPIKVYLELIATLSGN